METKTFIDKSKWQRGEWNQEPDRVFWSDPKTGYPCIALRAETHGGFCGYVGIPPTHPWFGKSYHEPITEDGLCPDDAINVHGGLTFSDKCQEDKELGICHKSKIEAWWFGFDCAHFGDFCPVNFAFMRLLPDIMNGTYKNFQYVKEEITSLAKQLKKYERKKA